MGHLNSVEMDVFLSKLLDLFLNQAALGISIGERIWFTVILMTMARGIS
jgi:hypothetical protein